MLLPVTTMPGASPVMLPEVTGRVMVSVWPLAVPMAFWLILKLVAFTTWITAVPSAMLGPTGSWAPTGRPVVLLQVTVAELLVMVQFVSNSGVCVVATARVWPLPLPMALGLIVKLVAFTTWVTTVPAAMVGPAASWAPTCSPVVLAQVTLAVALVVVQLVIDSGSSTRPFGSVARSVRPVAVARAGALIVNVRPSVIAVTTALAGMSALVPVTIWPTVSPAVLAQVMLLEPPVVLLPSKARPITRASLARSDSVFPVAVAAALSTKWVASVMEVITDRVARLAPVTVMPGVRLAVEKVVTMGDCAVVMAPSVTTTV